MRLLSPPVYLPKQLLLVHRKKAPAIAPARWMIRYQ
ncbi:hypothetical protein M8C21_013904 [Ambrosia artemisiifolia]|uniref:Uncharacterized protein n=1 Tax=Ambrosia artemisiifolia TaxID=4212 RepID=A0AAD5G2C7_AMBAR|nr:hypothetical protein M8C21_013904 [Ambrosia artemisiifolia]